MQKPVRLLGARVLGLLLLLVLTSCSRGPEAKMHSLARDISRHVAGVWIEGGSQFAGVFESARTESVSFDSEGHLVAHDAYCHASKPANWKRCQKGGHDGLWAKANVRLDLTRADPGSIKFATRAALGSFEGGQMLGIGCKAGQACISFGPRPGPGASFSDVESSKLGRKLAPNWTVFVDGGKGDDNAKLPTLFMLPCKDEKDCHRIAGELKRLVALSARFPKAGTAKTAAQSRPNKQNPDPSAALVRDINQALRNREASFIQAGAQSSVDAIIDRVTLIRPDRLKIAYANCRVFEPINLCPRTGWLMGSTQIDLGKVDPQSSGAPHTGDDKSDLEDWFDEGLENRGTGYVKLACKSGAACRMQNLQLYHTKGAVPDASVEETVDCKNGLTCTRVMLDMRILADLAAGKKTPLPPPATLTSEAQAKAVAKRILKGYARGGSQVEYTSSPVVLQGRSLERMYLPGEDDLIMSFSSCRKEQDPGTCTLDDDTYILIPLKKPGLSGGLSIDSYADYKHRSIQLVCRGSGDCGRLQRGTPNGIQQMEWNAVPVACPDGETCERTLLDLWALVTWLSEHPQEKLSANLTDDWKGVPGGIAPSRSDAARETLSRLTSHWDGTNEQTPAALSLPANGTEQVMIVPYGADLSWNGDLLVYQLACRIAPTATTGGNETSCPKSAVRDYDFFISLGKVDPSSIHIVSRAGDGRWIAADCVGTSRCTRFVSGKSSNAETKALAASIGDLPAPPIRLSCRDARCTGIETDFKDLVALVARPSPPHASTNTKSTNANTSPPPKHAHAAPDIAGLWEFDVPLPNGKTARWTMDFRVNGTYRFEDASTGSEHKGTYQCADGTWSLEGMWVKAVGLAPGAHVPYDDQGTYKLLGPNKMQLTGKAGTAVWKRISRHS